MSDFDYYLDHAMVVHCAVGIRGCFGSCVGSVWD